MKLEDLLQQGVTVDDEAFKSVLDSCFPLTGDGAVIPKTSRARKPKTRRTNKEWNELLIEMYSYLLTSKLKGNNETIKSYMTDMLQLPEEQNRRVYCIWKELKLNEALDDNIPSSNADLIARIDAKYPKEEEEVNNTAAKVTRDCSAESNSYFNESEEEFFCHLVGGLARMGFPMDKDNLQEFCNLFLKAEDEACLENGRGVSISTIERIYKFGAVAAKNNVNPIDPKRAAQADPQVLNAFYHQLNETIKVLHEINPTTWPEDRYANIPPTRLYNADEQGPNPTKLRNPVLIPQDMIKATSRLFQNTREGDGKMAFHYSVCNVVCADGVQCIPHSHIEGAPAPFILISDAGSDKDLDSMDKTERDKLLSNQSESDKIDLNEAVLDGWFDQFELGNKETAVNQFGFQIRATPSGSMLKRTFFDFIHHFVDQLPFDQGPNGVGVVLHLDWHSSRECPQSLITALLHFNILISVLPAKTSIWAQPCDNGKNELTAKAISKAGHDLGMLNGRPLDYYNANKIFRSGLEANCLEQNDELRRTGSNAVVTSFAKTGLYPMSYQNEGWKNAFYTFGKLNELLKRQRIKDGERIPEITRIVKAKPMNRRDTITEAEQELIESFLAKEDFLSVDSDPVLEIPVILLAMAIAEQLLGIYNQNAERDTTKPPEPNEPIEVAALKLVEFVGITVSDHVDTTCTLTEEQIAQHKLRTKLSLLPFGHSISLRAREEAASGRLSDSVKTPKTVSITKQGENKYIQLDGDRRQSRNFAVLTVTQILDSYVFDDECKKHQSMAHPRTAADKAKSRKKERVLCKKQTEEMSDAAIKIADERRLKRNYELIEKQMANDLSGGFVSKLQKLLEDEGSSMKAFHNMWETTLFEPYTDTISITQGGQTKEFDVTRVGSDVSAVSHKASLTFLELFQKLKEQRGNKPRRKRRRGPGQSTHSGKPGYIAGILIQRAAQQEEKLALEKRKKTSDDELQKLQSLLETVEETKKDLPDLYWICDKLKGKRRTTLARLFDVYKLSMKAMEVDTVLRSLHLTKAMVDDKIDELKALIKEKEEAIPSLIAGIRECSDFLDATNEYDDTNEAQEIDGGGGDVDSDNDDDLD